MFKLYYYVCRIQYLNNDECKSAQNQNVGQVVFGCLLLLFFAVDFFFIHIGKMYIYIHVQTCKILFKQKTSCLHYGVLFMYVSIQFTYTFKFRLVKRVQTLLHTLFVHSQTALTGKTIGCLKNLNPFKLAKHIQAVKLVHIR